MCTTCDDGYYLSENNETCHSCPYGCSSCASSDSCTACNYDYILRGSKCLSCSSIDPECSTCDESLTTCTKCSDKSYLFNNTCLGCSGGCNACLDGLILH